MQKISSNRYNFADDIKRLLEDYRIETTEVMTRVIPQVAREATSRLKKESPRRTGDYAKNWTYKVNQGRLTTGAVIYGNAPTFRMAHLLEHGHANRDGGRTDPIVHIQPVEDWASDEVINRTIDGLEKITL